MAGCSLCTTAASSTPRSPAGIVLQSGELDAVLSTRPSEAAELLSTRNLRRVNADLQRLADGGIAELDRWR